MTEQYVNSWLIDQHRHWWCQQYQIFRSVPCASPTCFAHTPYPVDETSLDFCCENEQSDEANAHSGRA